MTDLTPLDPQAAASVRDAARATLRRWLTADEPRILDGIDALGAPEVAAVTDLTARLRVEPSGAETTLDELRALVEAVHSPPRPRFELFARPEPPLERRMAEAEPRLAALLDRLARDHDALLRDLLAARALGDRLEAADENLEYFAHLLHGLDRAADGAARELAGADPAKAASLRGPVAERLAERGRDVLTQLTVLRQARLSLVVLLEGQDALARAIERVRRTTIAALRTAVAAYRSVGEGRRLSERAARLDGPEGARAEVGRALDEMRDALR